jgi:diguanylate cyclase (GGDEF)-like protein
MVYVLIAFLVGATASALVMAARERRRSMRLAGEIDRLEAQAAVLERRDGETGLWNSRHFVDALTQEIERSRTYNRPVALALASVDGLEEAGDDSEQILRALGSSIGGSVRALDVACRVGSAEFGVIMAETDSRSAAGIRRHRLLPGSCRRV